MQTHIPSLERQIEVLQKARELIEQGWCKLSGAQDAHGNLVHVNDPDAVCWCAMGSVNKITDHAIPICDDNGLRQSYLYDAVKARLRAAVPDSFPSNHTVPTNRIIFFNDCKTTTQVDIIAVFDKAIERCGVVENG